MTWAGWLTVQDVSDGPAPIDVFAVANAGDKVKPWADQPAYRDNPEWQATEADALNSNTEGKLRSVEVRFVFEEDDPPLAVGDLINVNGHFTRRVAATP